MVARRSALALSALMLISIGCGTAPSARYDTVEIVNVSGTIKLDGQPLPQAVVTFEDPTNGTFSFGLTDSGGSYSLQLDSVKSGVTVGQKTVKVSTTRKILGLNASEEGGESNSEVGAARPTQSEKVPAKYNQKSELTADVSASKTRFDFELSSK